MTGGTPLESSAKPIHRAYPRMDATSSKDVGEGKLHIAAARADGLRQGLLKKIVSALDLPIVGNRTFVKKMIVAVSRWPGARALVKVNENEE